MISITTTNNNTGRPCRFRYERVHFFLPSALVDTRREKQIKKANANHTTQTPLPRAVHPIVSKNSTHLRRSKPKLISSHQIRKIQPLTSTVEPSLQNPQILGTSLPDMTSSTNSIHSNGVPSSISCQGVYYDS